MPALLGISGGIFLTWFAIVLGGHLWWLSNRADRTMYPWNWRLLIWGYVDWAWDQRERRNRAADSGAPSPYISYAHQYLASGILTLNQARLMLGYPNTGELSFKKHLPVRERQDPFVGYKTLKVVAEGGRLRFQGATGTTYDLDATAECHSGWTRNWMYPLATAGQVLYPVVSGAPGQNGHLSPDENCTCGFYALSERPMTWEYGAFMASVELFGKVVVGKHGWRAARQRVLKIEAQKTCRVNGHDAPAIGFSTGADGQVIAVCEDHGGLGYVTLAQLTGKIGTEVRWSEPAELS